MTRSRQTASRTALPTLADSSSPTQLIDNNDPVGHPVETACIERPMRRCPASTVNAFSAASNGVDSQEEVDIEELPKEQCTTVNPGRVSAIHTGQANITVPSKTTLDCLERAWRAQQQQFARRRYLRAR
jgi:hypothetical protein